MAKPDRQIDRLTELMWATGLLEGDGAFCVNTLPNGTLRGRIQCQGRDPEVLERLRDALGTGLVNGPYAHAATADDERGLSWTFQINRHDDVARIGRLLKEHMSRRRQNQIARMLEAMGEL